MCLMTQLLMSLHNALLPCLGQESIVLDLPCWEVFFTITQRIWGVSLAVAVKPADDSDQISNKARHRTFHESIIACDDIFLVHSCYVLLVYGCKIGT